MLRSVREQDLRFWMEYFPPFSLITTHLYVGAPGISWYNSPQYSSTAPSYGMNKTSQLPPLQSFSWCRCCSWQFQVFGSCGSFIIPHVINTQRAVPIITIYIYILFTSALLLIHADVSVFNKGHQYVISWTISPCAYLCNWCYQGVEKNFCAVWEHFCEPTCFHPFDAFHRQGKVKARKRRSPM